MFKLCLLMIICVIDSYAKNIFDSLEIHVFNVQQGDSQLVVFPSGYSMLIDAGETSSKSTNYNELKNELITGLMPFLSDKTGRVPIILPIIMDIKNYQNEEQS